jgi:hypothetical protein
MGGQDSVVIIACLGLRIGVHQRGGQPRQRKQQIVLGADRDLVRLDCSLVRMRAQHCRTSGAWQGMPVRMDVTRTDRA